MIKVTLEFKSVDEAIVALGRLVGVKVATLQSPASATQSSTAGNEAVQTRSSPEVAVTPTTPPKTRKPRSDAGKERGPYKDAAPQAHRDEVRQNPSGQAVLSPVTPAGAAPVQPAAPQPNAKPDVLPQVSPTTGATPSTDDVQKAVEKLFAAKDYDPTLALLSRFGVKRGKDILAEQRAEFIRRVDEVIAGAAI